RAGERADTHCIFGDPIRFSRERISRQVDAAAVTEHAIPGNIVALAVQICQGLEGFSVGVAVLLERYTAGVTDAGDQLLSITLSGLLAGEIPRHHALEEVRPFLSRASLLQDIHGVRRVLDYHRATLSEMVAALQQSVAHAGKVELLVLPLQQ